VGSALRDFHVFFCYCEKSSPPFLRGDCKILEGVLNLLLNKGVITIIALAGSIIGYMGMVWMVLANIEPLGYIAFCLGISMIVIAMVLAIMGTFLHKL
jgi:hypothetical protein